MFEQFRLSLMILPRKTNRSPPCHPTEKIRLPILGDNEFIDWFHVISPIERAGYSLQEISEIIDQPTGTLKGWKYGARPKFEDGLPLIALWSEVIGQSTKLLPIKGK